MVEPQVIVIDGPDGVGKTTQVHLLASYLAEQGANVHVTRASGGTPIGEELRKASLSLHDRRPETDVYISLAMHTELGHDIVTRRDEGQVVIVDRSPLALLAYNVYGSRLTDQVLGFEACKDLLKLWDADSFIYMDTKQSILDSRRQKRGNTDYFENQDGEYHHRVREGYEHGLEVLKASPQFAKSLVEIDADQPIATIANEIQQSVAR